MAAQNCARKGGARTPSNALEGGFNGPGVGSSRPVGSGPDELLGRTVHEHSRTNRFRGIVLPGAPEGGRGGHWTAFFRSRAAVSNTTSTNQQPRRRGSSGPADR